MSNAQPFGLFVGQPLPAPYDTARSIHLGALLELSTQGILVFVAVPGISGPELDCLREHPIRIGLLREGDALYLVTKFGNHFEFDLSYSAEIGPDDLKGLPERGENEGLAITIAITDSETGKIAALRMVTITPKFSRILETHVADLIERSKGEHWNFIGSHRHAMMKYPAPTAMWPSCEIIETAGQKFKDRPDLR